MQPRRHEGHEDARIRKRKFVFFVFLRGLRVFVVAFVLSGAAQGQRPADDAVERGKQTYMKIGCYQCHGREAQGASTGPRLGPQPLPLPAFARAIRTPRNDMPPYSTRILSDAELSDLHAFVAARPRPHELPK
jgi:mono/diheme cytochrome c family protein